MVYKFHFIISSFVENIEVLEMNLLGKGLAQGRPRAPRPTPGAVAPYGAEGPWCLRLGGKLLRSKVVGAIDTLGSNYSC